LINGRTVAAGSIADKWYRLSIEHAMKAVFVQGTFPLGIAGCGPSATPADCWRVRLSGDSGRTASPPKNSSPAHSITGGTVGQKNGVPAQARGGLNAVGSENPVRTDSGPSRTHPSPAPGFTASAFHVPYADLRATTLAGFLRPLAR
jgi:hypothetical protein